MRKPILIAVFLAMTLLVGCHTKTTSTPPARSKSSVPRDTTKKILADDSKIWLSKKQLLSQQTSRGLSEQITVSNITQQTAPKQWQMIKGQLTNQSVSYQPISFKKWQHDSRRSLIKSYQKTLHLITVAQANTALKKLGANFKISHLSDFIFLETKTGQVTINQGFIAKGNQLYAISTQYRDSNEPTTFNRGQLFTSHKIAANPTAKPVTLNHLNGTWIAADTTTSANDTGKMMVKDGFLYQQRYDSLERSAIQDLSQYSLMTLNQNTTYAAQKRAAAQADYELTPKSIASGDSIGYLYLFMNDHVLLRIGAGQTTSYQKTDSQLAASDLSQTNQIIFKQLDQQKPGEAASTITVKAGPAVVGMSKSLKYITDATAGQITKDIVISDIQNGQISIASESAQ